MGRKNWQPGRTVELINDTSATRYLCDFFLRDGLKVGGGEGEATICSCIIGVQVCCDVVFPLCAFTQI